MKANNVMKLFLCRYGMVLSILVCFGFHPMLAQSDFIFTGKVTEAASGEPIIGATVRLNISNANFGTATDLNGNYQFTANIAPGSYQLVASYVGFKEQVMTVDVGSAHEVSTDFALGTDRHRGAIEAVSAKACGNPGRGSCADAKTPSKALCQHTRPVRQAGHRAVGVKRLRKRLRSARGCTSSIFCARHCTAGWS
jgi:hypothetical protein